MVGFRCSDVLVMVGSKLVRSSADAPPPKEL